MKWNQDAFKRALDFAAASHGAQVVPGSGFPYVVHVTKVASEVLRAAQEDAFDVDLAVACALLHDTVEDAGVTHAQLVAAFDVRVADGVLALTKNDSLPKAQRMPDSLARIGAAPREIAIVKLADRVTNLEPPPPKWTVEKRVAYWEEAKVIAEALRGKCEPLEERIKLKIAEYEQYCR
jgi:(p)ppGpp synthase/HD superfamily hydrolase